MRAPAIPDPRHSYPMATGDGHDRPRRRHYARGIWASSGISHHGSANRSIDATSSVSGLLPSDSTATSRRASHLSAPTARHLHTRCHHVISTSSPCDGLHTSSGTIPPPETMGSVTRWGSTSTPQTGGVSCPPGDRLGPREPPHCHHTVENENLLLFLLREIKKVRPYPKQPCQPKEKKTVHPVLRKENHIPPLLPPFS